ncbi:hypothetical protein [Haloactinospora alba]|uniref:hypothetical protein n=1 Tax=Haloactinospora alba TaxID=405555 RepID=UPI00114F38B3|nr:hypothetical protein [Haloactinospora alba]
MNYQAVELLAPDLQDKVDAAVDALENGFADGTHIVGEDIQPGTYTATASSGTTFSDAYWDRASTSGDILANDFVTSAQSVTVTISSSDGQFTSRGFGFWEQSS